jgi:hypothetical protein
LRATSQGSPPPSSDVWMDCFRRTFGWILFTVDLHGSLYRTIYEINSSHPCRKQSRTRLETRENPPADQVFHCALADNFPRATKLANSAKKLALVTTNGFPYRFRYSESSCAPANPVAAPTVERSFVRREGLPLIYKAVPSRDYLDGARGRAESAAESLGPAHHVTMLPARI